MLLLGAFALGVVCFIVAYGFFLSQQAFLDGATRVDGIIVKADPSKDGVVVRYRDKETGDLYQAEVPHDSKLSPWHDKIGTAVTMLYDPDDPSRAARTDTLWGHRPNLIDYTIAFAAVGIIVCFLAMLAFLIFVLPEMLVAQSRNTDP